MRIGGFVVSAWALAGLPMIAPPPAASAAEPSLAQKGEYLTTAGDCAACHTAPGGKPFAGGLHVETPFGYVVSPNITPDRETGIGAWSDDQFYRAMHEGLSADGGYLYPVFPFNHYTKVTRDDVLAIRAYMASVPAVSAPSQPNGLSFPYNIRESLVGWRQLYFQEGDFVPDPASPADVNRGAYLVQGLGHCGACHTPRNALGGPERSNALQGAAVQGWYAPNISGDVREGVGGWSLDQLVAYLKTGSAPGKGVVAGPMSEVVHTSLAKLTDEDVRSMAAYLKSTPAVRDEEGSKPLPYQSASAPGEGTYLRYCASCHGTDGRGIPGRIPPLAGNGSVTAEGPENVIRAVVGGFRAQDSWGPMPAMGADMTTEEIAAVTNYVRNSWSNVAPATAKPGDVAELAARTPVPLADRASSCPAPETTSVASAIADPANGLGDLLRGVDGVNMIERVATGLDRLASAVPGAPQAQLVNGLIDAYCPVVAADEGMSLDERRWQLHRFTQLVYTEATRKQPKAR